MRKLYTDYQQAERDCEMIAGDNEMHMVVVERFDLEHPNSFAGVVVNHADLDDYIKDLPEEAFEVILGADHTPETRAKRY